jgi:putative FmdB family regulatory protein
MPIYEYQCQECGQINELLVLKKDEVVSCKSCNSQKLEKLMSAHNTVGSGSNFVAERPSGCCGAPNSCGSPGSCCSG